MILKSMLAGALLAASVVACAQDTATRAPAMRESAVEVTGNVEAVNSESREVMVRTGEGRYFTATLGPQVRNFDQIQTGDTVRIVLAESVVAEMAAVDDRGDATGAAMMARAPEGARPGAVVGEQVSMVVTIDGVDPESDRVTFTTPDELTHSVVVRPEMRDFAMDLEPGDRVRVTFTEAVAITVEETAG